jgi:hypothetical protein
VRILATLCCVAAALAGPVSHAQQAEPPPSKGTFDEKGGSGKMALPTKRIYGERFHRNIRLPGPRPLAPRRMPPPPEQSRYAPMRTRDYPIAPRNFFDSARADIDLIHRSKWNIDDPELRPAPLSILENPRPFDPRRVTGCGPACNPDRASRQRAPDRTAAIRGIDQQLKPDADVIRTTARNPAAHPASAGAAAPELAARLSLTDGPSFDASLIGRDADAAVGQLRTYLAEYPDDFHAVRLLALALLANKNAPESAAVMAGAYTGDPLLAGEPVDLTALSLDRARTNALITAAQSVASRSGGNAWLVTVVLHQGAGDMPKARAALQRAAKAGLSPEVVLAFEGSLGGPASPRR